MSYDPADSVDEIFLAQLREDYRRTVAYHHPGYEHLMKNWYPEEFDDDWVGYESEDLLGGSGYESEESNCGDNPATPNFVEQPDGTINQKQALKSANNESGDFLDSLGESKWDIGKLTRYLIQRIWRLWIK